MTDQTKIMKTCSKCKETKPLIEGFYRDKSMSDGRYPYCKACQKAKNRDYYVANRESLLEYQRQWHEDNKEHKCEYSRQWREANPEYSRQYRIENPEVAGLSAFAQRVGMTNAEVAASYELTVSEIYEVTAHFYTKAQRLTKETGELHHVDHITPVKLGGKHLPDNLQVLSEAEHKLKTAEDRKAIAKANADEQ